MSFTLSLAVAYLLYKVLRASDQFDLIKAKGIVIVDSAGNDRILIGAPIPYSAQRVRTDTNSVRSQWAKDLGGDEYMNWYKGYHHSMNGILLLNEAGHDKLAVGDNLPDPNTGQRITSPTGMTWNDEKGFERGGLGLGQLKENGKYRNILGLDDEDGEGLHLAIFEDGSIMMRFVQRDQVFCLLANPAGSMFGNDATFIGWKVMKADGQLLKELNLLEKDK